MSSRVERSRRKGPLSTAARIIAAASDIALFVDHDGVVRDLTLGEDLESVGRWNAVVGKPWRDTVTVESRHKVEQMLREARARSTSQAREINQKADGGTEVPFRFKAVYLDEEDRVVALGRDLRPLARLQQGLVTSQQAMDREYARLRQADTRYRVLFHVSAEGVLVVDGETQKVLEANPAAASMVGDSAHSLQGRLVSDLFDAKSQQAVRSLLAGLVGGARPVETRAFLAGQSEQELSVSASLFRQGSASVFLVRFWPLSSSDRLSNTSKVFAVIEAMPDGFVVTDPDRRILTANTAFCELVNRTESQIVGESIERWLGRPGVDLNIIQASLKEHGVVKNFATVLRSDFGATQEALVTAASALDGKVPCLGFTVRIVSSRLADLPKAPESAALPRSVEQLRELVGRVPLKDLVRESADLVERLCIEAALMVSHNNRASAAQLLGLSRQGFYSKMKRYGIAEFGSHEQ
ncbi:MAG: transcriptional regulator PpsR [Deltaproteobacteria bacterium]|nr:transcriptional regulator PpsR [Deltaproteobacteria bacterium]